MLLIQGAVFGDVGGWEAALVAAPVVAGTAAAVRHAVRLMLVPLRTRWIEDLARQEGLDANALAASFTLDSW